jgi:hypothetical protein
VAALDKLVRLEARVRDTCSGYNETELGELRARLGRRVEAQLFIGSVSKSLSGDGKLSLANISLAEFAG